MGTFLGSNNCWKGGREYAPKQVSLCFVSFKTVNHNVRLKDTHLPENRMSSETKIIRSKETHARQAQRRTQASGSSGLRHGLLESYKG